MKNIRHLVATVPKALWFDWIDEGDAVGEPESGEEWGFFVGGHMPQFETGSRLYIVAHNRVRGYAPITRFERTDRGFAIGRRGGAVAVTLATEVRGFRGWRYRWWHDEDEIPFPDWRTAGVSQ